jgi:hypothetical protein
VLDRQITMEVGVVSGGPSDERRGLYRFDYSPYQRGIKRADERTRTADLISLRVISQALQVIAGAYKSRISRRVSLLRRAANCTVLRPRWCQSGVGRHRFSVTRDGVPGAK